jgi:hypothetical protein
MCLVGIDEDANFTNNFETEGKGRGENEHEAKRWEAYR